MEFSLLRISALFIGAAFLIRESPLAFINRAAERGENFRTGAFVAAEDSKERAEKKRRLSDKEYLKAIIYSYENFILKAREKDLSVEFLLVVNCEIPTLGLEILQHIPFSLPR